MMKSWETDARRPNGRARYDATHPSTRNRGASSLPIGTKLRVRAGGGAPGSLSARLLGDTELVTFANSLVVGVQEHKPQLDALISEAAENWRIDRMAAIDRNILRLGAFELLHCPDLPAKVAINKALELAKRYSTAQSSRFVNGVLDRLQNSLPSAEKEKPAVEAGPAE